jgi:uncharacterized repeat protein (TIGR01451 family)
VGDITKNSFEVTGTRTVQGVVQNFTASDFVFNTFGELQMQKTSSGVDPLSPGDQFTYTVTVTNPAVSVATYSGVAVYDALPAGVAYVAGSGQVTAPALEHVLDEFSTQSYSNNDGNINWNAAWTEIDNGAVDGPAAGGIQVSSGRLQIGNGSVGNWTNSRVYRDVNLAAYGAATLTYNYDDNGAVGANDVVEVWVWSTNTGWNQVATHNGVGAGSISYDLAAYIGDTDVTVSIEVAQDIEAGKYRYLDNVKIITDVLGSSITKSSHAPPSFVMSSDGYSIAPGQTLTLTFDVTVDDPLATGITSITNVASVTTTQTPVPLTDDATNIVNNPSSQTGTVGDRIWLDTDGDGVLDIGEPGLGNVTLTLKDQFGTPVATTTSDSNGFYSFTGVLAGTGYYVEATSGVPSGLQQSAPSGHTDDRTNSFDLLAGQNYVDADLGYTSAPGSASLGDRVWSDADGDGIQDAGEPGISGVTVELYLDGGDGIFNPNDAGTDDVLVTSVVSAADGSYLFTGVTATGVEDYWVSVIPAGQPALTGYTATTIGAFSFPNVSGGDVLTTADFGFQNVAATYSITDRVWFDVNADQADGGENGLAGVTVDLLDASLNVIATVTTDASGYFTFNGVAAGNYTVKVTDTGGVLNNYYGTTTEATAGQYGITALSADLDNTATPSFGYNVTRSIGDTVFNDANGNGVQDGGETGISGVTVELQDGVCTPGTDCPTVVTDGSGHYLFSGLTDGSYTVSIDGTQSALTGYNLTTADDGAGGSPHTRNVTLAGGVSQLGIDYGYQAAVPTLVSGTLWNDTNQDGVIDGTETGLENVTLDIIRAGVVVATVTTDASGNYSFTGLPGDNYTVQVTDTNSVLNGYVTTYEVTEGTTAPFDSQEAVNTGGGDVTGLNFGYYFPKPTLVTVVSFNASTSDTGAVYVEWQTASEIGTTGFRVERLDASSNRYQQINREPLPALALMGKTSGGTYILRDEKALSGETYQYRLIEEEIWGGRRIYGPFMVQVQTQASPAIANAGTASFNMTSRPDNRPAAASEAPGDNLLYVPGQPYSGEELQTSFVVQQEGLVFVNLVQLQQMTGLSLDQLFAGGSVQLSNNNQVISWWPIAGGGGYYAYVQGIDSLYTGDNVYQLKAAAGMVMAQQSVAPLAAPGSDRFVHIEQTEKDQFAATVVATDPESDYWYWDFLIAGNATYERKNYNLDLVDVLAGRDIQIALKGFNSYVHTVEVSVNGQIVGSDSWFGISDHIINLTLPVGVLVNGVNTVELFATGSAGQGFYLDSISVGYDHALIARDNKLSFQSDSNQVLQVSSFSSNILNLLDITDPQHPVWLTDFEVSGSVGDYSLSFAATAGHQYFASTAAVVPSVSFRIEEMASWNFTALDYLVISPWSMRTEAAALAAYRDQTGLRSAVVYLKDIYRIYGYGIESPHAIRAFLNDARQNWQLRYVTLAGSASYDYRGLLGGTDNLLPTLMAATPYGLTACDTCLADFDADGLTELVIARVPASDGADLTAYLGKLSAYEVAVPQDKSLMLADNDDPLAGNFSMDSDQLSQAFPLAVTAQKVYLDSYGSPAAAKTDFLAKFNANVDWFNYVGHGAENQLSASAVLTTADIAGLTNSQSSIVTALTCGANRFEVPGSASLGESLTMATHGAVAVWAPSGLSLNDPAVAIGDSLLRAVYQNNENLLGEAVDSAMRTTANVPGYMRHIYNLLGDSAVHVLGTAAVETQTDLSAITGGVSGSSCSLNASGTWLAVNGPYVMDCDLIIEAGVTLTIDPGVVIKTDQGRKIIARGNLQVIGGAGSPIRLRPRLPGGAAPIVDFVQEGAGSITIRSMSISQ